MNTKLQEIMIRFNVFIVAILFAAPETCFSQVDYHINGITHPYSKGSVVYLEEVADDYNKEPAHKIDSAIVGSDGKFVMQGKYAKGRLCSVGHNSSYTDVIIDEGTVKLDLTVIPENISGTPLNEALLTFKKEVGDLLISRGQLENKILNDTTLSRKTRELRIVGIKDSITQTAISIASQYIKAHKNDGVAEYAFHEALRFTGDNMEVFERLYNLMDRRKVYYGSLRGDITRLESVQTTSPGCKFKDFTIANGNLDGTSISLSDYVGKGKFVLLDFWASWCFWCRAEFPTLAKVYQKYKGPDFEIVGLVVDDKIDATKAALKKDTMVVWPQIVNAGANERKLYGVYGIPQIILFAPDGTIVARGLRGITLEETVTKSIEKYRKEKGR